MTRLFCITLALMLASHQSILAQEKNAQGLHQQHRNEVRLDKAWELHDGQPQWQWGCPSGGKTTAS